MACELGLDPRALLDTPVDVFEEMTAYLAEKAEEAENTRLQQELQHRFR